MALTQQDAVKKATDLLNWSYTSRMNREAFAGLCLAYAYGNQWAGGGRNAQGGIAVQQLRTITDANRSDVRFCFNEIQSRLEKVNSRLMPRELEYRCVPATRSSEDFVASLVGTARLERLIGQTKGLQRLRRMSLWRCVLGSAMIRRTLCSVGQPQPVTGPDGGPIMDNGGNPKVVRKFEHGWAVCPDYEFIRDPSVLDTSFDSDEGIGHEKPRPISWLRRNFPNVGPINTKATMGKLLEFQKFLQRSVGASLDIGWSESDEPAVMVSEWWFRDSGEGSSFDWPWYALCWRDTTPASPESYKGLNVIHFGRNPYHGLPIHAYTYRDKLLSQEGIGIPGILMQVQDAINVAMTNMIRRLVWNSGAKYLVEENSLADDIKVALSPRLDKPIVYRKGSQPPARMQPTGLDPLGDSIMANGGDWFDRHLNMSRIQFGISSKRGESGQALQAKSEQADTPLTAISDADEATTNELLTGTLQDALATDTVEGLVELLGDEYPANQIAVLKSRPATDVIKGVRVVPESIRPKTPQEVRRDAFEEVQMQMVDPVAARRGVLMRGGKAIDYREGQAVERQRSEIQAMLDGQPVLVEVEQDHAAHLYVLSLEMESHRWPAYSEEQRQAIRAHAASHDDAKTVQAQNEMQRQAMAQGQQPGQPQGQQPPPQADAGPQPPQQAAMPADQVTPGMEGDMMGGMEPAMAGAPGEGDPWAIPGE